MPKKKKEKWERQAEKIWVTLDKVQETLDRVSKEQEEFTKEMYQLKKRIEEVTDSIGRFAEGLVVPCVERLFKNRGIEIENVAHRCKKKYKNKKIEIDIICEGKVLRKNSFSLKEGSEVVIIGEVKSFLQAYDVYRFLNEKVLNFYEFFPVYKDKPIICFMAAMNIEEGVDIYVQREGLYMLMPSDDNVIILNPKNFKPKIFYPNGGYASKT